MSGVIVDESSIPWLLKNGIPKKSVQTKKQFGRKHTVQLKSGRINSPFVHPDTPYCTVRMSYTRTKERTLLNLHFHDLGLF